MTPFEDIYDISLVLLNDRSLKYHYDNDRDVFNMKMQGYLMVAIPYVTTSLIDRSYDLVTKSFNADYTLDEIGVYRSIIERLWWKDHTNVDILITEKMQGRDNKISTSNLKPKLENIRQLKEEISKIITDYEFRYLDKIYGE